MSTNLTPLHNAQGRFTLLVSGEDTFNEGLYSPPCGLPHERFLLGEKLPIAPVLMLSQSNTPVNPSEMIACLQPVHLHATRDHLILMTQDQIDLTLEESTQLLQVALPFIEEDFRNKVLLQGKHYWFISAGPFADLMTHSIDQAHGRNIDWWMPRDSETPGIAKLWRKLQNEIQMLWHIDPVNQEREQRSLPSINSLWISGIGKLADIQTPNALQRATRIYGDHPLLLGLAKYLDIPHQSAIDFSKLSNGFAWLSNPSHVWKDLSDALLDHRIAELEIIDFPEGKTRHRILSGKDIRKKSWVFWKNSEPLSWQEITASS